MYSAMGHLASPGWGCPIRTSTDHSLLAAPRGLSQPSTSFIGSRCQGIHRAPLVARRLDLSTPPSRQDQSFLHDPTFVVLFSIVGVATRRDASPPCLLNYSVVVQVRIGDTARGATNKGPTSVEPCGHEERSSAPAYAVDGSNVRMIRSPSSGARDFSTRAAPSGAPRTSTISTRLHRLASRLWCGEWSRGDSNP